MAGRCRGGTARCRPRGAESCLARDPSSVLVPRVRRPKQRQPASWSSEPGSAMRNGDRRWLQRNSCRHAGRRRANACLVLDFRGRSPGAALVSRMVSLLICACACDRRTLQRKAEASQHDQHLASAAVRPLMRADSDDTPAVTCEPAAPPMPGAADRCICCSRCAACASRALSDGHMQARVLAGPVREASPCACQKPGAMEKPLPLHCCTCDARCVVHSASAEGSRSSAACGPRARRA